MCHFCNDIFFRYMYFTYFYVTDSFSCENCDILNIYKYTMFNCRNDPAKAKFSYHVAIGCYSYKSPSRSQWYHC